MTIEMLNEKIDYWSNWLSTSPDGRYDIALLKIWIQFEKFVSDVFLAYATGQKSETEYSPELKIQFEDEEQFNVFMRDGTKKYVDYLNKIEKLSSYIFVNNPFDIILSDVDKKTPFNK